MTFLGHYRGLVLFSQFLLAFVFAQKKILFVNTQPLIILMLIGMVPCSYQPCSVGEYIWLDCFCWYYWMLCLCSGWTWQICSSSKVSVQTSFISWFSFTCPAAITHRSDYLHLDQQNRLNALKDKFKETSGQCKDVREFAKFAYAKKLSCSVTFETFHFRDLGRVASNDLSKVKSAIPIVFFMVLRSCTSDLQSYCWIVFEEPSFGCQRFLSTCITF